jgi:hypothetical protein
VAWASQETAPPALENAIDTALGATFRPVPSRARPASKAPAHFRA